MQPLRQGAGLQADPRQHQTALPEVPDQRVRLAGHLGLAHDAARAVHHAHAAQLQDRKSTRLNSSHANISYAVFCLKKKNKPLTRSRTKQGNISQSLAEDICEVSSLCKYT